MMILSFLVFLVLVILGHYFAWKLFVAAWPSSRSKKGLVIGLFIFITIFFLSVFIFLHNGGNALISTLYVVSAVLFGWLTQMMLFGALYWLVSPFKSFIMERRKIAARIAFGLAIFFTLFGAYNAMYPRVKTITLKGWPQELSGKSFVHLSDLHLGAVYRPSWLRRIVTQVNGLDADFVVISGDLIDGSDKELSEFAPALRDFAQPVVFTPGNHDYYVYGGQMERLAADGDLILLSDASAEMDGIEVIGFNYLARNDSDLRRDIAGLKEAADLPRIVLNHVPVDQAEADALGAKLMLSGHTHRGQIFPFSAFTYLLYGRYSYGLETYGGMTTYTSAGVGTWGPPLRTLAPGEIILFKFE